MTDDLYLIHAIECPAL